MKEAEKPTAASVLSLVAGVFILLGAGMSLFGLGSMGMMGGGMMGDDMMGDGVWGSIFGVAGVLGLVSGPIVIISALMLNKKPEQHQTWGTLIVLFSVLGVFGSAFGGFGIGLLLGLIGGILAITWKPT